MPGKVIVPATKSGLPSWSPSSKNTRKSINKCLLNDKKKHLKKVHNSQKSCFFFKEKVCSISHLIMLTVQISKKWRIIKFYFIKIIKIVHFLYEINALQPRIVLQKLHHLHDDEDEDGQCYYVLFFPLKEKLHKFVNYASILIILGSRINRIYPQIG